MLAAGTPMATSAENPDLIYEIAFFQFILFGQQR
jgi:hypothetical protein